MGPAMVRGIERAAAHLTRAIDLLQWGPRWFAG